MAVPTKMASSRLYKNALADFVRISRDRYFESKDIDMLNDFLLQRGSPEEAREAANILQADASKKWGTRKMGDAEIPGEWIHSLMENIAGFVSVGNYAMQGAPESVGLAWFAVKLTLSAIQSNYALYTLFGAGLTDISEIMILIPHYDRLYDEKMKPKAEWKQGPVVDKLFKDITAAYVAVLSFSFSIRRHLSAGAMAKLRHGFKDFFGASEEKFRGKLDDIALLKKKVLDDSQAIFQDKSLHHLEAVKGIVLDIQVAVNDFKKFQDTLQKMHEEQVGQWQLVLKKMEELGAKTKPITPWDQAVVVFEKNKEALSPQKNTGDALSGAIDLRHPSTCQWIFEGPLYKRWEDSTVNELLCLSGQQGSGKSVVLATVVEQLGLSSEKTSTVLYFSCSSAKTGPANKGSLSVDDVCQTLLYLLYDLARENEPNVKLLEDCNKVFENPKAGKIGKAISQSNKDEKLPEFVDAFLSIAKLLELNVIVALDEVDRLSEADQRELASRLKAIVAPPDTFIPGEPSVKVLVGCRSGTDFPTQIQQAEIDVGDFNKEDITRKLTDDLRSVSGLSEAEQQEAIQAIVDKAGPRFTYVNDIALPFMREPFQRPLSRRLEFLPEGMNNIYNEALRKMRSNYVDLLRTALQWTLLAPVDVPLKAKEIMDAYHGTYNNRGPEIEAQARELTEIAFDKTPALELEQLRSASGPFLRLEQASPDVDHTVSLRDDHLVREFCLHFQDADSTDHHVNGEICARCKSTLAESKALVITPKQGHLDLALTCLRHLNNPIFQRCATAGEKVPQWSSSGDSEGTETMQHSEQVNNIQNGTAEAPEAELGDGIGDAASQPAPEKPEEVRKANENMDAEETSSEKDADGDTSEDREETDDNDSDSDESMDDEDRGEINLAKALEVETDNEARPWDVDTRETRYELLYWTYHLRRAEELWSPEERAESTAWAELMNELDYFVSANPAFFQWWQTLEDDYESYYKGFNPLNVSAYFGLTSWAEYLLSKGADPNELSGMPVARNAIQAAALRADSRPMLKLLLGNGADPNAEREGTPPAFHAWLLDDSSLDTVRLMLEHGANPTLSDKHNHWTALHYFAWQGTDTEVLDLLLEHSVDGKKPNINALDSEEYRSPLHVLLWRREVPKLLLKAFLKRGADVNLDTAESTRPLQLASVYGDLETLQILCERTSDIDDEDKDGNTALKQAAMGNHAKCLKFLAEKGANTNSQNKHGQTALHSSAEQGAKDCVEILLAHGAQPSIVDKHNRTPLFSACLGESLETANLLFETLLERKTLLAEVNILTKRRRSPLRQAAGRGFDGLVDKMIKAAQAEDDVASLAINEPDTRKGMTALHRAAWFGQAGCVKLLLAANADVTVRDHSGKTALVLAYEQWTLASHQSGFEEIISLLVKGAPDNAIADAELVAICAINGSTRLLRELCNLGADLNRQDRYGWTPLDLARKFQQESAGRFLKQQAAWAGMLPSRWAPDVRTGIAENGTTVSHSSGERVCVSTDKPLPAGLDTFYFEITSKPLPSDAPDPGPEYPEVALGFCTIGGHAIQFPGWVWRDNAPSARSWGYHGDDGKLYISSNESGNEVGKEMKYRAGDTVGCGVDLTKGRIWFTRNGVRLESEFEGVGGRLFPLLGLKDRVVVETNFRGPFVWREWKAERGGKGED